jgi:DNA invertase Pin-like site-specific DNA recombinase
MSVIGYSRASTVEQSMEPQVEALKAAGCERIYQEQRSGVDAARQELARMIDYCRKGDVIVCASLDRIGRSTKDVLNILERLEAKGVSFRCLNINLDTGTPTGKLMLTMLVAVATFEREIVLERQRDGIQAAKIAGKYKGRKATAQAQIKQVLELLDKKMTKQTIADTLDIGVASVYRIIKARTLARELDSLGVQTEEAGHGLRRRLRMVA